MADLTEASVWSPGIYRIERSDAVIGADPLDPANIGISNVQAKALGDRTRFLRNQVDGAGIGVSGRPNIADFNDLTLGGMYRSTSNTPNAPTTSPHTILHIPGSSTAEATQLAFHVSQDRVFIRRKQANAWSTWAALSVGIEATFSHGSNGWQRLPSGLIIQWGVGAGATLNNTPVSFPIAFPSNLFAMTVSDLNAPGDATGAHIIGYRLPTLSGFNVTCQLHDGTNPAAGTGFNFIAIGN